MPSGAHACARNNREIGAYTTYMAYTGTKRRVSPGRTHLQGTVGRFRKGGNMIQERRQFLVDTPLAPDERQRLEVYEAAIEANFAAQTAGVLAAEQIRTERLWREE